MPRYFLLSIAAATVLLPLSQAAADDQPTAADAHNFLGEVFNAGGVRDDTLGDSYRVLTYERSSRCASQIELNREEGVETISVDWSKITSYQNWNNSLRIKGAIEWTMPSKSGVRQNRDFKFADAITAKRASKAVAVLIDSCASHSKFD